MEELVSDRKGKFQVMKCLYWCYLLQGKQFLKMKKKKVFFVCRAVKKTRTDGFWRDVEEFVGRINICWAMQIDEVLHSSTLWTDQWAIKSVVYWKEFEDRLRFCLFSIQSAESLCWVAWGTWKTRHFNSFSQEGRWVLYIPAKKNLAPLLCVMAKG